MQMKKLLNLMMIAVMAVAFSGCSSDDEPEVSSKLYDKVVNTFYNDSKEPVFTPSQVEGVYVAVASSQESSHAFIERLIGESWDGKTKTIALGLAQLGSIQIKENTEDGVYNEIIVNAKDYTPFTLKILDKERANEDNGYTGEGVAFVEVENFSFSE